MLQAGSSGVDIWDKSIIDLTMIFKEPTMMAENTKLPEFHQLSEELLAFIGEISVLQYFLRLVLGRWESSLPFSYSRCCFVLGGPFSKNGHRGVQDQWGSTDGSFMWKHMSSCPIKTSKLTDSSPQLSGLTLVNTLYRSCSIFKKETHSHSWLGTEVQVRSISCHPVL